MNFVINGFDLTKYFVRIDCSKLHPKVIEKALKLIYNCVQRGYPYYAISGYRDPIEQDSLYAIGRTVKIGMPTVTQAAGFKSYHNYGLAIDFCFDQSIKRDGLQPDWEIKNYKVLAEEAEKLGFMPGMKFTKVDAPHIQIPLNMISLTKLEELYKAGGLDDCWKEITRISNTSNAFKSKWGTSDTPSTA